MAKNKAELKQRAADFTMDFKIAMDGCSGVGKGLIGSLLAKEYRLTYIESSLIYRGLAFLIRQEKIELTNQLAIANLVKARNILQETKNSDLRTEFIGQLASKIAVIADIRQEITNYLQNIMQKTPRIIMEGRDIGTIIAPQTELKIFLEADLMIRAKRRYKQLQLAGKECSLDDIFESLKQRDLRDQTREIAPLKPAKDAVIIDTTYLSPAQVMAKIKKLISL